MAICYCQNKDCERIFSGEEILGIDLFAPDALLPCGHKPSQLVFGASVLRDDKEKAAKYEEMEPRLKAICDEVCDMCEEETPSCNYNPFGKECRRSW
ncbi:MAG: hypothetical protein K2J64_09135 [Desulfovibrio sp.]|nr:hypothetical protein [Desulfovibrio sp.]